VHDDMPCMDNDTLRRGKETTWKKFGEYQWLLVWDFLNTIAFELLTDIKDSKLAIQLIHLLSRSTGYHGMIWWQIDDMHFETHEDDLNMSKLLKLHNRKTWALIRASVQWWILVSGKIQHIHKLSSFWEKLGLAFQIKDDILDVEGTVQETGKSVWWEDKWFVHFLWIEKSKKYLDEIVLDCYSTAKILKSKRIDYLIGFVKERSK
jgi:geranylgeranyl pyrophosphate synthase